MRLLTTVLLLSLLIAIPAPAQPPKGQGAHSPLMGNTAAGKEFKAEVIPDGGRLVSIQANVGPWKQFGDVIKGVKFVYEDAKGKRQTAQIGPCDGKWEKAFDVPAGAQLVGVSGSYGLVIDNLQFHFSDGTKTPSYGGKDGDLDFHLAVKPHEGRLPYIVRGLHGKATDTSLLAIGLSLEGAGIVK